MRVAVLGAGSWGTALAVLLARNGQEVVLLGRDDEGELESLRLRRENVRYLPGFAIPSAVEFAPLGTSLVADLVAVAVPSVAVGSALRVSTVPKGAVALVCAKGLECPGGRLLTEVAAEAAPEAQVGVLSGPNLAVEVVRGVPTVAVAAFADRASAALVREAFACATFRVSIGDDVVGVGLGGALKNVLAIGGGLSDGLGFGDNTKGALLSRGLQEMARLGAAMGARAETFLGPAGVGDLFATAASGLSRNYRLGRAIASGASLHDAMEEIGQVAEGAPTSEAAIALARRHGVEMPVFAAVEAVLRARVTPARAVELLMERASSMEAFAAC